VDESGVIRHGPESAHPIGCLEASTNANGDIQAVVAQCNPNKAEQRWGIPKVEAHTEL
jgi:hypothetical protein